MWTLSSHNHSVLRLYRFRDIKVEQRYQEESNRWNFYNIQVHYTCQVIFEVLNLCTYIGCTAFPTWFWVNLAHLCCVVALTLGLYFSQFLRRRSVAIHGLYCTFRIGYDCASMFVQSHSWFEDISTSLLLDGAHLILSSATQSDVIIDERFHVFLQNFISRSAIVIACVQLYGPLTHLALTGLNPWTVLGYSSLIASFGPTVYLLPEVGLSVAREWLFVYITNAVAYTCVAMVIERLHRSKFLIEVLLKREMHSAQTADSILNHTLKNTLADVGGNIELYLADAAERTILQDAMACLQRGIKSCKERQVYLKLVSGTYRPVLNTVNLKEFGEQLVAGRSVAGSFLDSTVLLDHALCSLILENALSNAFKHGNPANPGVRFSIRSQMLSSHDIESLRPGFCRLCFSISNTADPTKPKITPQFATQLFAGEAEPEPNVVVPLLSDRIGLTHCLMAAELLGLQLSLRQNADRVVFSAVLEAPVASNTAPRGGDRQPVHVDETLTAFPAGLRYFVIDDSSSVRRLLEFHLKRWCQPEEVRTFGAVESDVALFVASAKGRADVVIIDQHLEFAEAHLGTDLVRRLLDDGFPGFICIRSANDEEEDRELYRLSGAHCSFGKDLPAARMVEELKRAYLQFRPRVAAEILPEAEPSFPMCVRDCSTASL